MSSLQQFEEKTARFCDYVPGHLCFSKRNIYGHQKINLIINFKKNEKTWILKTLYGKHLLDFLHSCTQIYIFISAKDATFFVLRNFP